MNNDQLFQLKSLGSTPDSELVLLYLLGQYQTQSQNAYLEASDLLFLDFDSSKIYRALSSLKERKVLDFQASSLRLTWANSFEEERLDLQEITSHLVSGVLTEEQAFYYEILLQKPAAQSQQVINVYNWAGVRDYGAGDITRLAYDWSSRTAKLVCSSDDWLIFWEKDFSSFASLPPAPSPAPPSSPPAPSPSPAQFLSFATPSGSISSNTEVSWSFEGLEPGSSYRIDMLGPDATATSGQTINTRNFLADSSGRISFTSGAASGEEHSPGNRGVGDYRLVLLDVYGQVVSSTVIILIFP